VAIGVADESSVGGALLFLPSVDIRDTFIFNLLRLRHFIEAAVELVHVLDCLVSEIRLQYLPVLHHKGQEDRYVVTSPKRNSTDTDSQSTGFYRRPEQGLRHRALNALVEKI
jgi:hypothetical protein